MLYEDDDLISLINVALKIKRDLLDTPGHQGLDVNEETAKTAVPDRLYMFLNVVLRGSKLLDSTSEYVHENQQTRVLSITQDFVYAVSNGTKWTPKHIGLGSILQQVTRSRQLVELFHRAGDILSYRQIPKLDTLLAQNERGVKGAVIPPNSNCEFFIHFTASC